MMTRLMAAIGDTRRCTTRPELDLDHLPVALMVPDTKRIVGGVVVIPEPILECSSPIIAVIDTRIREIGVS
jgi:hypothetical protein